MADQGDKPGPVLTSWCGELRGLSNRLPALEAERGSGALDPSAIAMLWVPALGSITKDMCSHLARDSSTREASSLQRAVGLQGPCSQAAVGSWAGGQSPIPHLEPHIRSAGGQLLLPLDSLVLNPQNLRSAGQLVGVALGTIDPRARVPRASWLCPQQKVGRRGGWRRSGTVLGCLSGMHRPPRAPGLGSHPAFATCLLWAMDMCTSVW